MASQELGVKVHNYALRLLPHHDRLLNTPVEPMHVPKNVIEHIACLIVGAEDSRKVHDEEKQCGHFRKSWVQKGDSRLQPAPFRLTAAKASLANSRVMSIRVPYSFDWKPKAVFVNLIAMKSHSWKQMVSTFILKYCLRGLLGRQQRESQRKKQRENITTKKVFSFSVLFLPKYAQRQYSYIKYTYLKTCIVHSPS